MTKKLKIGIIHYRAGRADGVSFEIAKRKEILEAMGHEVHLIAGQFSNSQDYLVPQLENDLPEIIEIKKNAFRYFNTHTMTSDELMHAINNVSDRIKESFLSYHKNHRFDLLLVHNIFSYALHLPAAKAFAEIINEYQIPTIATNHDYYWERPFFQEHSCPEIKKYIQTYLPYKHKLIKYISINTAAQQELLRRRSIQSDCIGDVLDFNQSPWVVDDFNKTLTKDINVSDNDLIILQATRIVIRKGIEIAFDLVKSLEKRLDDLVGKPLFNGKILTEDSKIVIILPGFTEVPDLEYREKLERKIDQLNIQAHFINGLVGAERYQGKEKIYSLWDCYAHADLVTYPSQFEGWGNQFMEAVFAKKPITLFEYPVFKTDIKKEGYHYISLGDTAFNSDNSGLISISSYQLKKSTDQTIETLLSGNTQKILNYNYSIGKKNHHYEIYKDYYNKVIQELILDEIPCPKKIPPTDLLTNSKPSISPETASG